ncbi:hypothetical protein [Rhodopirellula sp. P2]|uniref:hypothetical protein n=1 Tax=Rhodopirellula sp. P2 TaxID=2127060 RepID=UPI002368A75B|nr:hypothetical protein [Rhodopirellula sp. P2]WDQ15269.1 hypothetical protein PSR62_16670 [Rhodopirellula sp. P2]
MRSRQVRYALIAITFPPAALFLLAGPNAQGIGIILLGALIGTFIACGIFVSGTKRFSHVDNSNRI